MHKRGGMEVEMRNTTTLVPEVENVLLRLAAAGHKRIKSSAPVAYLVKKAQNGR